MRDLGLEGLGAQLSLLGRQVASALDSVLPAEVRWGAAEGRGEQPCLPLPVLVLAAAAVACTALL